MVKKRVINAFGVLPSSTMAENQKKIEFLTEGSTVEVRMEGAWYEADVVAQCADSKDRFRVLCSNISTRYEEKLMDVNISSLRPRPPPPAEDDRSFELRDVVDVLDDYGWWNGVVSGVYTLRGEPGYTVALFENPHKFADQIFTSERLRSHQVWTDDAEWVRPAKSKEIPGQGQESSTLEQLNPVTSTGRSNRNKGFLSNGSTVEVRMGEAWYEADIVTQCPKSEDVFRVLTFDIGGWWYDKRLRYIHMSLIRPRPPPPVADERYEPCEVVDVLHRGGWRKGVVRGGYIAKGKPKYTVVLSENIPELADKIFASRELRLHWDWTDDSKWVRPHNKLKEIPGLEEQSSTLDKLDLVAETSTGNALNTSEPETVKEFRKENPVISSAPRESQPASMAMISTCDVGINLAMKGKTGLAKSSKKRPREPDAHIMNQQVLAADNTNDESTEIARSEDFPFKKSSYLWKEIDSLEVFRMLPQNPHFSPLRDCNEDTREGTAIGHMWSFASLVEKVSKLRMEDPSSLFQRYLEALGVLETVGFDVKAVEDRINKLLAFKIEQESLKEMFEVETGAPW